MSLRQAFEHALKWWSEWNVERRVQSATSDLGGDHVDTMTQLAQEPQPSVSTFGIMPRGQVFVEQPKNGGPSPEQPTREPFGGAHYGPDLSLPSEAVFGRVKTHWGTVIFADAENGTLRHGPEESSPNNIMLADNKGTAYLFHTGPNGERHTVVVASEGHGSDEEAISSQFPIRPQAFDISPAEMQERVGFGLRSRGLLLCAQANGLVTLSRNVLGLWERFELIEVSPDSSQLLR